MMNTIYFINISVVIIVGPNMLWSFCLHFISSSLHYHGDNESGNVIQETQVLNPWWLYPINFFCFNFGSTHAIHHLVVNEPFYIRQLSASVAHKVMKEMTVTELMDIIMQDYPFYVSSSGGVTLSGGEMSLQTDFAAVTDLFLFDIKHIDTQQHKALFGIENENIRRNLEHLVRLGADIVIRMPLVRGYNDSYDAVTSTIHYVQTLAEHGNIRRIDVLPYHQLGRKKYERLGMIYPIENDPSYSQEELHRLEMFFSGFDIDIRLVRH